MDGSTPSETPVELDLDRQAELRIRWADGHLSVFPLVALRKACPCATCRAEREQQAQNPLRVISPPANPRDPVTVADAALVGNYAVRLTWNDGHDTGIYEYRALRRICPCAECRPPKK